MKKKQPRVVWITGASAGIGKALAEVFAGKGDVVIASARNKSRLAESKKRIYSIHRKYETAVCDVQNESNVLITAEKILKKHKHLDILINNAGVTYFKEFSGTTVKEFDHVINTNLRGSFLTTKQVLPAMVRNGKGMIINIVSYIVKEVYTRSAAYSASKAGMEAMMNVLRAEVRGKGINIVNVYPGAVLTGIWRPDQQQKFGKNMLLPEWIADMIYNISTQPPELMVEEIVIRPQGGDLTV